ncbi:MAG: YggT family protein [Candidatus Limnocylindrus sp.]
MSESLLFVADLVLQTLWWVVLGRVLISWFDPAGSGRIARTLIEMSEPILAPLRRILPPLGGIDWSPLATMLLLQFLRRLV